MAGVSVVGLYLIGRWKDYMIQSDSGWIMMQVLSKSLVELENHARVDQWKDTLIKKVVFVRIFNNLYPFISIGFLQQFTYEGCPATEAGCVDALEQYLLTYFAVRIAAKFAVNGYLL